MKLLSFAVLVASYAITARAVEFAEPVRMQGGDEPVRVERPGYASPCWADIDGDGKKDLLVGQFNGGKIRVFKNLGDAKLAAGQWLKAEGQPTASDLKSQLSQLYAKVVGAEGEEDVAQVPGVW
jgi:hypothetical protein